jgi:predicted RNase H-like HicB family nuclease
MPLPIKPTPKLNRAETEKFLERVYEKENIPSGPIHTPKLESLVRKLTENKEYKVRVHGKAYLVIVHPDLEDGGYWVDCPELPGCASQGDTVKGALEMIRDAIKGHLEVLAERSTTEAQD